jgi:hypothetical protein
MCCAARWSVATTDEASLIADEAHTIGVHLPQGVTDSNTPKAAGHPSAETLNRTRSLAVPVL